MMSPEHDFKLLFYFTKSLAGEAAYYLTTFHLWRGLTISRSLIGCVRPN